MYPIAKNNIIKIQQKTIEHLEKENCSLKKQLELYDHKNVKKQLTLAAQSYEEYTNLIRDITELKTAYQNLITEVKKDKQHLKKELSII